MQYNKIGNCIFKITSTSPRNQWDNSMVSGKFQHVEKYKSSHCSDVTQASRQLNSPAYRLFVQKLIQPYNKGNTKAVTLAFDRRIYLWFPTQRASHVGRFLCHDVILHTQSGTLITWSNITWYCIHHCSDWCRIHIFEFLLWVFCRKLIML